jgi:DNA-binding MarR family transcriptional regulator
MMSVTATNSEAPRTRESDELIEHIIEEAQPLFQAQRRVIAKVWQDRSVSKLNLHVLILLDANGPQSMSQLATLADVALPNLSGIIERMVERGLVKRAGDETDRRVVVIHSTAKGRSYVEQLESVRREGLREILRDLDASELQVCLKAMQLMGREAERSTPERRPTQSDPTTTTPPRREGR